MNGNRQKSSRRTSAPYFAQPLKEAQATQGQTVVLECRVGGYPLPEIRWEKDGRLLGKSRNVHTTRCGEKCVAELRSVREADLGCYTCVALNIHGSAKTQCRLTPAGELTSKRLQSNGSVGLQVPRTASFRSRSSERSTHRSALRSPSSPGKPRDNENHQASLGKQHEMEKLSQISFKRSAQKSKTERSDKNENPPPSVRMKMNFQIPSIFRSNSQQNSRQKCTTLKSQEKTRSAEVLSHRRSLLKSEECLNLPKSADLTPKSGQSNLMKAKSKSKDGLSNEKQNKVRFLKNMGWIICKQSTSPKDSVLVSKDKTSDVPTTDAINSHTLLVANDSSSLKKGTVIAENSCEKNFELCVEEKCQPNDYSDNENVKQSDAESLHEKSVSPKDSIFVFNDRTSDVPTTTLGREYVMNPLPSSVENDNVLPTNITIMNDKSCEKIPEPCIEEKHESNDHSDNKIAEKGDADSLHEGTIALENPVSVEHLITNGYHSDKEELCTNVDYSDPESNITTNCAERFRDESQSEECLAEKPIPPQITIHESEKDEIDRLLAACNCTCHGQSKTDEVILENIGHSTTTLEDPYDETASKDILEFSSPSNDLMFSTAVDETNHVIQVNDFTTPAKIIKGPASVTVKSGAKVTLVTNFIGTPPNKVSWMRGGSVLTSGGQYSIVNEDFKSELTIHSVTADDSGKYIATVENEFGGDSCFASVAVLGFPKPPGGPPTASDFTPHSLVLSWYGSMFDGGSVLTGYVVEMCQVPERHWETVATCVDTTCVIDGLSLGQRYLFRVRARNRYGQSEPSRETHTICLDDYISMPCEDNDELPNNSVAMQTFGEFLDRYELKEEVGRGKFGKVYRCVDKWTGFPRAAKMIRCRRAKERGDVYREIEVMKKLRHPKLLRIVGAFESDKVIVMVTEYISGGELFQRVIMDDFVLTESDCILFMRQICDAVSYMHRCSVLHLDLKPENILCKTRTSHQIKIIDFGLSAFHNPNEKLCILFGTPEFVAPEVIAFEPVGPPSDMWSVGVICYVLLSGLSPFLGDSESETFANITRGEIDFDEEEFDSISEDAKKFIADIVVKNPRRRLTAAECLNHPWLKRAYWLEEYPPLSTEKLKKFIIRRKWQKSGTAIRALRRFVTLSRSSAESFGESECSSVPMTPVSPATTDISEDSGIYQEQNMFDFSK